MSDNKKSLLDLKAFQVERYQNLDLDRLAVYALCVMESKKIPLYFDYAAVALFKLFPEKFSMQNFAEFPDTNRINKALRRLTDQKRKNWATGTVENGFHLNELGREIGKQVAEILQSPNSAVERIKPFRSRGKSAQAEVHEIKESNTYKKWFERQSINNFEFLSFLKAAPYTPKPLLAEHLKRLKDSAETVDDLEVQKFLSHLETNFKSLLQ